MRYRTHRQIIRAAVQSIAVHIPVCQFVWCSVVQLPTTKRPETVVTSAATFTSATIRLPTLFFSDRGTKVTRISLRARNATTQ